MMVLKRVKARKEKHKTVLFSLGQKQLCIRSFDERESVYVWVAEERIRVVRVRVAG